MIPGVTNCTSDFLIELQASHTVLVVSNLPANAGDSRGVNSNLGCEDPLEMGMATQSNILAWKIAWAEEYDGPQSIGLQRVRHD